MYITKFTCFNFALEESIYMLVTTVTISIKGEKYTEKW